MPNKKLLALVLILMMGLSCLTGCSPAEKSYYSLLMETNNLKVYQDSGSIQIDLAQLPASTFAGDDSLSQAALMKAFSNNRIEYQGQVDANQKFFQYEFTIIDNASKVESKLSTVVFKNDIFYIQINDLVKYFQQFCDSGEVQQLNQILGDVEWISISSEELNAMMPAGSQNVWPADLFGITSARQTIWQRLMDGLVNDAYSGFQSGLITQSANRYTLTIRGADVVNMIKPLAVYTIQNIDKIAGTGKTFLNSLSPAELTALGFNSQMQAEMIGALDMMVMVVDANQEKYLAELTGNPVEQEMLSKVLNDSELISSIEKVDAQTYQNISKLHLHISDDSMLEQMEVSFNMQNTIKTGGQVQVAAPTAKVITLTALQQRLPRTMEVRIDSGAYTLNNGFFSSQGTMSVQMKEDRTYLPLRLTAESMGEIVGWDEALFQAYVVKNGQRINMTSILVNDRAYIKIRDFEQLGYQIDWTELTQTVTMVK